MQENGFEKLSHTEPTVEQGEIKFPEAQTPWERMGLTKEEYNEIYADDPNNRNVELYKQR